MYKKVVLTCAIVICAIVTCAIVTCAIVTCAIAIISVLLFILYKEVFTIANNILKSILI